MPKNALPEEPEEAQSRTQPARRRLVVVDNFFTGTEEMREVYDARFGTPRAASDDRFVWDFWHIPDQYSYLRTRGQNFFPASLYDGLVARLRAWGLANLGCAGLVRPWLSYYVDGCHQALHADVPQGPWAYVLSLTRWEGRRFRGGETLVARDRLLDFWSRSEPDADMEETDLLETVPARFNRLTVFDARFPHGVRRLEGTRDPVEGRIAVHGWFREPRVLVADRIASPATTEALEAATATVGRGAARHLSGLVTARVRVAASGRVEEVEVLSDMLYPPAPAVVEALCRELTAVRLQAAPAPGWAVVPLRLPVAPSLQDLP